MQANGDSERGGEEKGRPVNFAVDVGCGSGQATQTIAQFADHVLGVDVSQSQIDFAKKHATTERVTFK